MIFRKSSWITDRFKNPEKETKQTYEIVFFSFQAKIINNVCVLKYLKYLSMARPNLFVCTLFSVRMPFPTFVV